MKLLSFPILSPSLKSIIRNPLTCPLPDNMEAGLASLLPVLETITRNLKRKLENKLREFPMSPVPMVYSFSSWEGNIASAMALYLSRFPSETVRDCLLKPAVYQGMAHILMHQADFSRFITRIVRETYEG